jgi:hypothetical protein
LRGFNFRPALAEAKAIIAFTGKLCCQRWDLLQEAGIADEVLHRASNACVASKAADERLFVTTPAGRLFRHRPASLDHRRIGEEVRLSA